jgi:hypothetical protein
VCGHLWFNLTSLDPPAWQRGPDCCRFLPPFTLL